MATEPKRPGQHLPPQAQELAERILYPKPSELKEVWTLIDALRKAQNALLLRALQIGQVVEKVLAAGNKDMQSGEEFEAASPDEERLWEDMSFYLSTSSLFYAQSAMLDMQSIEETIQDDPRNAEEVTVARFWDSACQMPDEALLRLAGRPPRHKVSIPELEEKLREVARRFGLLEEEGK